MAIFTGNLIWETATTTGTPHTLTTVSRSFNDAFGTGGTDVFLFGMYNADAPGEWMIASGHLSASDTLVVDTVYEGSNGTSEPSWSAGTKHIVNGLPASRLNGAAFTVRAATTANITIATALNNGDSLDDVTLATGDLVLVKDQSAAAQNAIIVVGATPARALAFCLYDQHPGALITVQEGTVNAGTQWLCTSNVGGTLDTTAINFREIGSRVGNASFHVGLTPPPDALECDGLTIGDGSSGATARANADTWRLFEILWDVGNTNGTLSIYTSAGAGSTYGADAATDWAAHKRIALPDAYTLNKVLRPADGSTIQVGEVQTDGAPDIDGTVDFAAFSTSGAIVNFGTGVFSVTANAGATVSAIANTGTAPRDRLTFAASADDPTYSDSVNEVRMNSLGALLCIYYR